MIVRLIVSLLNSHDLDNIVLEKLKNERTMSAVYELEALVATGISCELSTLQSVSHLQLKRLRHYTETCLTNLAQ